MPSREWSHICRRVTRTVKGEWLPVDELGVLAVPSLPVVIRRFHVISNWSGRTGEHFTVQIIMKSPSGEIVRQSMVKRCVVRRNRAAVPRGQRLDVMFLQTRIGELGEYHIEFLINGVSFHWMPFVVALKQATEV